MTQISRQHSDTIVSHDLIKAADLNDEFNSEVNESNAQDTRLNTIETNEATFPILSGNNALSGNNVFSGNNTHTGRENFAQTDTTHLTTNGDILYDSANNLFKAYINGSIKTFVTTDVSYPTGYHGSAAQVYASASTFTVASIAERDSTDTFNIKKTTSTTVDITTSGLNGLDTGSEASGTWYYLYAIAKADGSVPGLILSVTNEAVTGSITLPATYTLKRQLPFAVRNDGSSNFLPWVMYSQNGRPYIEFRDFEESSVYRALNAGTATSFTGVSLVSLIPGISKRAALTYTVTFGSNNATASLRPTGSGLTTGEVIGNPQSGVTNYGLRDMRTDTSQSVDYKMANANSNLTLYVKGFYPTEVN